jgi:hypothetical protein
LPAEIAQGLCPNALAAEIVTGVREQFLKCGVPEAGKLLKEQGDSLRQLATDQAHTLADMRQQLNDSRSRAKYVLDSQQEVSESSVAAGSACGTPMASGQARWSVRLRT